MFGRYKNALIAIWPLMTLSFMAYFFLGTYQENGRLIISIFGGVLGGLIVSAIVTLVFLILVMRSPE